MNRESLDQASHIKNKKLSLNKYVDIISFFFFMGLLCGTRMGPIWATPKGISHMGPI